jgi:hypothetical protein
MRMPSEAPFFKSRVLAAETFELSFYIFIGHGISFSLPYALDRFSIADPPR